MEMKFYKCAHCGQIIAIVKETGVTVICCGEPMQEIIPGTTDAAAEKHIPVYEVKDGKVKVGKVNVDEQPELASAFRVASIPTVVVIKDGKVTNMSVGYRPKEQIEALL